MGGAANFGIGSFAFEWTQPSGDRDGLRWRDDVRETLESLANVSNVVASSSTTFLHPSSPGQRMNRSSSAHPYPNHAHIAFDIKIPHRQQSDVPDNLTMSENFRVFIEYGYESPVAFVFPLGDCDRGAASESVRVVREHLWQHLDGGQPTQFSFIGPSPFHADFQITGVQPPQSEIFSLNVVKHHGYDDYDFSYSDDDFGSLEEATAELRDELTIELSLYYELIRLGNERLERATEVGVLTRQLIQLHTRQGLRARAVRLFGSGHHARELSLAVMEAEFRSAWDAEYVTEALAEQDLDRSGHFETAIAEAAARGNSSLVANGRNVVSQLESGRTKELEVTLLASSTVAGAVAGGLISALMANGSGS